MINPWCLADDEMEQVRQILERQDIEFPALIWLTALANMECSIYEDVIQCTNTTKEDALYFQRVFSDEIRKFISGVGDGTDMGS